MSAEDRFQRQVAHLSEPDILPRFIENGGDEDPAEYLSDGGGAPGGDKPYLYEFVCADLKIKPRTDAVYLEKSELTELAQTMVSAHVGKFAISSGDALKLARMVIDYF